MRLMQMMAGQAHGGAEAFFERLAIALQQAGECQRLVIRENGARAGRLGAAGCSVAEVPFGGRLDRRTPDLLRREIAEFAPDIVLTWMNRASAACPSGGFVQIGRLGGYYDLKYYRTCRELVANTRSIVDYVVASGWPARRVHYLPNFSAESIWADQPQLRAELATP
ncbi:MAG: glycosyltransferase, partial [Stellaceae bacterium]